MSVSAPWNASFTPITVFAPRYCQLRNSWKSQPSRCLPGTRRRRSSTVKRQSHHTCSCGVAKLARSAAGGGADDVVGVKWIKLDVEELKPFSASRRRVLMQECCNCHDGCALKHWYIYLFHCYRFISYWLIKIMISPVAVVSACHLGEYRRTFCGEFSIF